MKIALDPYVFRGTPLLECPPPRSSTLSSPPEEQPHDHHPMTASAPVRVPHLSDQHWNPLLGARATDAPTVARAYAGRKLPDRLLSERGTLFLVAADHPARGALASGGNAMAMADRRSLLAGLVEEHPDVDGVRGSPDVVEELLLFGAGWSSAR
jgi:hypothetical protein